MNTRPITHPPLAAEDLDAIAARHTSPAARALLREIERLRTLEACALSLCHIIESGRLDAGSWGPHVIGVKERAKGQLPSVGKFGRMPPDVS
ncbi:MAG: hypothetical protein JNM76_14525 [Betaproteobacteria bacterium]|nr:hypothetical protein [Betaproteobacteria bacterium]